MRKQIVLFTSALLCSAVGLTSCNDDEVSKIQVSAFGTLEGSYPNYSFYVDGGGVIRPSVESVVKFTSGKGFSDNLKRAWMVFVYEQPNLTYAPTSDPAVKGEAIISKAEIVGGKAIPVVYPLEAAEAEAQKVTDRDSLFAINSFDHVWYYRGYLTARVSSNYSIKNNEGVYPTMNLVYDPVDYSSDTLRLKLCYNRHSSSTDVVGGTDIFDTSFPMNSLFSEYQKDSINIVVAAEGVKDYVLKVPTK